MERVIFTVADIKYIITVVQISTIFSYVLLYTCTPIVKLILAYQSLTTWKIGFCSLHTGMSLFVIVVHGQNPVLDLIYFVAFIF